MADVVDLAAHSGLPVETVLRVLQREPMSEAVRAKVAEAVLALGLPEYPLPDDHVEVLPAEPRAAEPAATIERSDDLAVELRSLFEDVIARLDRERRERIDDLELTTNLLTETWRNVDRRLGRLEKIAARLERSLSEPPVANGGELRRLEDVWRRRR